MLDEFNETWAVGRGYDSGKEFIQVTHRPSNKAIRDNYYWFISDREEIVKKLKRELIEHLLNER
jgi:hypothetical protein